VQERRDERGERIWGEMGQKAMQQTAGWGTRAGPLSFQGFSFFKEAASHTGQDEWAGSWRYDHAKRTGEGIEWEL
jgi:hypothetical protein